MADQELMSNAAEKAASNRAAVQSLRQGNQSATTYNQAVSDLSLTPQEQFLYQHHLDNLSGAGKVIQPNGDISTLLQVVVTGPDGKFYNIPTVWGGRVLSPPQATQMAAHVGWDKWPSYGTSDQADARYEKIHEYLGQDVSAYIKNNPNYRDNR